MIKYNLLKNAVDMYHCSDIYCCMHTRGTICCKRVDGKYSYLLTHLLLLLYFYSPLEDQLDTVADSGSIGQTITQTSGRAFQTL